ncbi:MAG: mechanosensitive ion channel family protein, partial [Planctomycetota bacterium]
MDNGRRPSLASNRLLAAGVLLVATCNAASAQSPEDGDPPPPAAVLELKSPRATLATFLRTVRDGETENAIACLDVSGLTEEAIKTGGPSLTYQLKVAIDRFVRITLPDAGAVDEAGPDAERWLTIPDENDYPQPYPLSLVPDASPVAKVLIIRRGDDGNWRFSQETRETVEALYADIEQESAAVDQPPVTDEQIDVPLTIRLRNLFPPSFRQTRLLIPDYQWLCLAGLILVGLAADLVTRGVLTLVGNRLLREQLDPVGGEEPPDVDGSPGDDLPGNDNDAGPEAAGENADADEPPESTKPVWRPMGRLVNAAVWYQGAKVIGLPSAALSVLLGVLKLFTIVAAAWTAFTVIDLVGRYLRRRSGSADPRFDDLLVPLASRTLKVVTIAVALLTAAQAFSLPVLGLVGGLGLGGAALALASKDAVANFFGSVTVLFDRPFDVGDYIITDGMEGTVESVGFRSTRLRTFNNSLVTLPNSLLTTSVVDNMGARHYRRVKAVLSLEYSTTPDQIDAFCEAVRQLIRDHPHTRKDSFHVYFNSFGPSSLDVIVYCFLQVPDWGFELQEKHRLFADILRVAEKLGVRFAFPTQTLH